MHVSIQLYDQVQTTEITLYNGGKVDLDFCAMGVNDTPPDKLSPGEISVSPLSGNIQALEHQSLTVHYLPGRDELHVILFLQPSLSEYI